ncbi:hypothetical protein CP533_0504 [Ophiocordyceps camponoti-saundersi (nom. inval.)]|nr:hypothetical protein CP533_0504 [Ophiocordyceps camponoti-saundersi (nom. inval.)]
MFHHRVSLLFLGCFLIPAIVETGSVVKASIEAVKVIKEDSTQDGDQVEKAVVTMEIYQQARSLHPQEEQSFWIKVINKGPSQAFKLVLESPKLDDSNLVITQVGDACLQTDSGSEKIYCEWRYFDASLQREFGMSFKYHGPLHVKEIVVPLTLISYLGDDELSISSTSFGSLNWEVRAPQLFEYDPEDDDFFPQQRTMEVAALPRAADEMSRLRQWFQWSDLEPTGFYLRPGIPLEVIVEGDSAKGPRPDLVIGTPDLVNPRNRSEDFVAAGHRSKPLRYGYNEVTCPVGGIIYIRYTHKLGIRPPENITITLGEGLAAQPFPFFRQGLTTDEQWRRMLMMTKVPFAELAGRRVIVTGLASHAMKFTLLGQDQEDLLHTYDQILAAQDRISGLFRHGTSSRHQPSPLRPMVVQSTNGRSGNSYHFRAAIPARHADEVWWKPALQKSWLVWHELGHHRQHVFTWSWNELRETSVNIYSLASQRLWRNRYGKHGSGEEWRKAKEFLFAWQTNRTVDFDMADDFVRLAMFEQLRIIFGDRFYHQLHTLSRESLPRKTTEEKKFFFMSRASYIAKLNLANYFEKWGLKPQPKTISWMARFPTPLEDLTKKPIYTSTPSYYV